MTISPAAWLEQAKERIFLCGVGDSAEQLGAANMAYGLAKILYAEHALQLEPRALFIGAPDATVTRNSFRWKQGFGYGGQVRWHESLAILDSKPNGCGMLVGILPHAASEKQAREAAREARSSSTTLDGISLHYDLGESNHFIDALELEQVLSPEQSADLPSDLFIIHSSGHEHRAHSRFGPGLYLDQSADLQQQQTSLATPWGPLSLLRDEAAQGYYHFCRRIQTFNKQRRELYGKLIFGAFSTLCNVTHQGMRAPGVMHLGAYWFTSEPLIPLTLGPQHPVYLLQPQPNFALPIIEDLQWRARAERLQLLPQLTQANILPHGGGYSFPQLGQLLRVESRGETRRFVLESKGCSSPLIVEDIRALPFIYRELAVLQRLVDLELARPVARYRIRFVIKDG